MWVFTWALEKRFKLYHKNLEKYCGYLYSYDEVGNGVKAYSKASCEILLPLIQRLGFG